MSRVDDKHLTSDQVVTNCYRELTFYKAAFDKKTEGQAVDMTYGELRRAIRILRDILGCGWHHDSDMYLGGDYYGRYPDED
jgi:hypothetical protein